MARNATQQRQVLADMIASLADHLTDQVSERMDQWNAPTFSYVGVDDLAYVTDRLAELVAFMSNGAMTKEEAKDAAREITTPATDAE
jgi:hypothetical protein